MNTDNSNAVVMKMGLLGWASVVAVFILLGILYQDGLVPLLNRWVGSHGYLILLISLFMIWQKKDRIEQLEFNGSWLGFTLVFFGVALFFVGELGTLYIIVQYSLLVVLSGLVLSLAGPRAFMLFLIPLIYLVFSIPLPNFLNNNLYSQLQFISSHLGVAVIRLFGISVFLEGNVIDLGNFKMQVVEASRGLRYLFPLMSVSFLCAYLFKQSLWKRATIFLSAIPIIVLMNSFRIAAIGVLVDNWGIGMAEGFLHNFEGWVIFIVCLLVLLFEMWVLTKIGGDRRPLSEIFKVQLPAPSSQGAVAMPRRLPMAFVAAIVSLVVAVGFSSFLTERQEAKLERKSLTDFPMTLGVWKGSRNSLEKKYLDALKLSDYVLANYVDTQHSKQPVNFYIAYYGSQRKGESVHSPRSCLPGDGWQIRKLTRHTVEGVEYHGKPFIVNRLHIQKGESSQLVYYWFQQRGRVINNEYLVKWYLIQDALTRNRTDGALVRLTTSIPGNLDISSGDKRLSAFAKSVVNWLDAYIPE